MVVELRALIMLQGEQFSPQQAKAVTGLSVSRKNEPGEIGTIGRYRGRPIPFGAAFLEAPESVAWPARLGWVVTAAAPHAETLCGLGAELWSVHVDVEYRKQCNLEFSPADMAGVAALQIPFTVSCRTHTTE